MVSIPACHAGDPGSIPGPGVLFLLVTPSKKVQVLPGLEPGLQGSKPWVLTNYTIEPRLAPTAPRLLFCVRYPLLAYVHVHTEWGSGASDQRKAALGAKKKVGKRWLPDGASACVDTDEI